MSRISVVIPTYNGVSTIQNTVDSVLVQTYTDFEILVVDDGSTDNTRQVLSHYGDRIRYIYQKNQERSAARNNGIRHALGDFIAFLDADDTWLPHKLEKQMEVFGEDPGLDMVYSQAYVIDERDHVLGITGSFPKLGESQDFYTRLLLGNFIPSMTPVVRSRRCQQLGGFDENLRQGEDWDYWLRLTKGIRVKMVSEPLACYRVKSNANLLAKISARDLHAAHLRIIEKATVNGDCLEPVKRLAFALIWLESSLVDVGLNNTEAARQKLGRALEVEPGLFSTHSGIAIHRVTDLAFEVCRKQPSLTAGEKLLANLWALLPKNEESHRNWSKAISQLHASRFFQGAQLGDPPMVRKSLVPMLLHDPSWLRNRGVWVIAWRAFTNTLPQRPGE